MRALIYGAGAIGTVFGAFVARAGKQIDLVSRNQAHVSALKAHGAHVVGTVDFTQEVTALLPEEMSGKYDVVFLTTKQRENGQIIDFLRPFLSENGVICTMQNGLPEAEIAKKIGADNTYGCAVAWGATFVGQGVSELTTAGHALTFSLGCYGKSNERQSEIAAYLSCMGTVALENNLLGARWSKLAMNAAFSGISALTGMKFGEIAMDKRGKRVALAILDECARVADAAHIRPEKLQGHDVLRLLRRGNGLKNAFARFILPFAMKKHYNLTSGMLHALKRGEKCEIDYIDGVVCKFGREFGVSTPVCDGVCEKVHEIERGERQITVENLKDFD